MPTKPQFRFHFDRSLQAAAYLLKWAKGREMRYIHLLKMLYIADREYLAEYGYTITGDKVVAMQYGPVLSRILNLIKVKGETSQIERWQQFIPTERDRRTVQLVADPGIGELSRASMAKLDSVFERFGNLKPFEVVRLTHEFPEWEHYYRDNTSTPIPWQAILRAQGEEKMIRIAKGQIGLQAHQDALQKACR